MADFYQSRPRVRLAEVREKKSANGKTYFSFYIGKARATMFRDDRTAPPEGVEALWNIWVEETDQTAKPRPQQSATSSRSATERQKNRTAQDARAEASMRERGINPAVPLQDDEIGF
jgi:hypothetical protein